MSNPSRLVLLSQQITDSTKVVDDFLQSEGCELSFSVDSALVFPAHAPDHVSQARRRIIEATKELNELVTGPGEHLRWLACNYHDLSSLRFISHFKLAEAVPLEGQVSFTDVAARTGLDERRIKSMMRLAMTHNIFREPEPGFVAHTAGSSLLVRNGGIRDWVAYTTGETYPASAKLVEATKKWGASEARDETAWSLANDTSQTMFEAIADDPARAQRFANVMTDMTSTEGYNIRHLVHGFAWDQLQAGSLVVDVGGSTGHASKAILQQARDLKFLVQDRPEIVAQGNDLLSQEDDEHMRGAISFEVHDFFTVQAPRHAAVYLMRFILHDHPDPQAIQILRSIVPALESGSRLVVMDGILPEPNTLLKTEERTIRIMDCEMMTTFNSRERELSDWRALFSAADSRLQLHNAVKPPGSVNSVMEVVFEG